MGLFTPIWMTEDHRKIDKAIKAVEKITDQEQLRKIAVDALNPKIADAAFRKIEDDNVLYEFARPQSIKSSHQSKALERIKEKAVLRKIMAETDVIKMTDSHYAFNNWGRFYCNELYQRLAGDEDVPLEWHARMTGTLASDKLVNAVIKMTYPQDRQQLIFVIENAFTDPGRELAIEKLPYASEKTYLEELLRSDRSDIFLKKSIAKKLPEDSELLNLRICPYCGAFNSVYSFDDYRQNIDTFVVGYKCRHCGHESTMPRGQKEPADFSLSLAQMRCQ